MAHDRDTLRSTIERELEQTNGLIQEYQARMKQYESDLAMRNMIASWERDVWRYVGICSGLEWVLRLLSEEAADEATQNRQG